MKHINILVFICLTMSFAGAHTMTQDQKYSFVTEHTVSTEKKPFITDSALFTFGALNLIIGLSGKLSKKCDILPKYNSRLGVLGVFLATTATTAGLSYISLIAIPNFIRERKAIKNITHFLENWRQNLNYENNTPDTLHDYFDTMARKYEKAIQSNNATNYIKEKIEDVYETVRKNDFFRKPATNLNQRDSI
jgi:hypothetical protein